MMVVLLAALPMAFLTDVVQW